MPIDPNAISTPGFGGNPFVNQAPPQDPGLMAVIQWLRAHMPSMPSGNDIMQRSANAGRATGMGMQAMMGGNPAQAATPNVAPQPMQLPSMRPMPSHTPGAPLTSFNTTGPQQNPLMAAISKRPMGPQRPGLDSNALPPSSAMAYPEQGAANFADPNVQREMHSIDPTIAQPGLQSSPLSMMRTGAGPMGAPGQMPQMNPANSAANMHPQGNGDLVSLIRRLLGR